MKVLVTGGEGFIGTHLCRELTDNGHEVTSLDLKSFAEAREGLAGHTPGYGRMFERDLLMIGPSETSAALNNAIADHEPEIVVHLAAQVGRVFGEDDITHTIRSNALMTGLVARSCAAAKQHPRLVYTSTSEIYGDLGLEAVGSEDWPGVWRLPHNLYGLSKRWGEEVAQLYTLTDDLEGSLQIIRPSMPYGPGLPAGRGRAAIVNMLYQAHNRLPIPVHRGAERSWCWIGDAVRGIRMVLEDGEVAFHRPDAQRGIGAYNIGRDDTAVLMEDVAYLACRLTGADPEHLVQMVDAPSNQTVVKRLSTDKLRGLGWEPLVTLEDGMSRTLEAMRDAGQLAPA